MHYRVIGYIHYTIHMLLVGMSFMIAKNEFLPAASICLAMAPERRVSAPMLSGAYLHLYALVYDCGKEQLHKLRDLSQLPRSVTRQAEMASGNGTLKTGFK